LRREGRSRSSLPRARLQRVMAAWRGEKIHRAPIAARDALKNASRKIVRVSTFFASASQMFSSSAARALVAPLRLSLAAPRDGAGTVSVVGFVPEASCEAEHSRALLAPLRCSLAGGAGGAGGGCLPSPTPPEVDTEHLRGLAASRRRYVGVVGFVPVVAVRSGTLACAPRSAAVLARAPAVTVRVGDASHPPHPQRWTVCDTWTLCGWRAVAPRARVRERTRVTRVHRSPARTRSSATIDAVAFEQATSRRTRTCQDSPYLSGRESAERSAGPSRTRSPNRRVATRLAGGRACSERDPAARSEASTAGRAVSWRDGGAARARSEASTAGRAASWRDGGAAPSPTPPEVDDLRPVDLLRLARPGTVHPVCRP